MGFEAAGMLKIETALIQQQVAVADIGHQELIFENGGIERRIRIFRLPDDNPHRSLRIERKLAVDAGRDDAYYVRVTFEDGHYAWSSPIYLIP